MWAYALGGGVNLPIIIEVLISAIFLANLFLGLFFAFRGKFGQANFSAAMAILIYLTLRLP